MLVPPKKTHTHTQWVRVNFTTLSLQLIWVPAKLPVFMLTPKVHKHTTSMTHRPGTRMTPPKRKAGSAGEKKQLKLSLPVAGGTTCHPSSPLSQRPNLWHSHDRFVSNQQPPPKTKMRISFCFPVVSNPERGMAQDQTVHGRRARAPQAALPGCKSTNQINRRPYGSPHFAGSPLFPL